MNRAIIKTKNKWLCFDKPIEVLQADKIEDVEKVLEQAFEYSKQGHWAVGFVCYEAAAAFDGSLITLQPENNKLPLVWFAIYCDCQELDELPKPPLQDCAFDTSIFKWQPDTPKQQYNSSISKIKSHIRKGDTYQVNYTMRLKSRFDRDSYGFFAHIAAGSDAAYCCYIETVDFAVCSFSPELFFSTEDNTITTRPVKGTIARSPIYRDDLITAEKLKNSTKDMAENVMIVDMLRNDLGKIATPGTVKVQSLFDIEKYPTLYQLSSTITAETDCTSVDVFKHLFPCASITGAPKCRTMKIISELENSPRGLYTGSIGYFAPKAYTASFNVAIRTVVVDKAEKTAVYGVGGGIVWDSAAKSEYAECLTKAAVLNSNGAFELIESILWNKEDGFGLLDLHLDRLKESSDFFGFVFSEKAISASLNEAVKDCTGGDFKVRLLVDKQANIQTQAQPIQPLNKILKIRLATKPVSRKDIFLYHKTTRRKVYEDAFAERGDCDEVLLFNTDNEITECTYNNIILEKDGRLFTPPINCGLLGGVYRRYLLDKGLLSERIIKLESLASYDKIYLVNSVRGISPAELINP